MPRDIFSGRPLAPSKCCNAGIITAGFMDKRWPVCSDCGIPIKEKDQDLERMNRSQLEILAKRLDMRPKRYPTLTKLVAAIERKRKRT